MELLAVATVTATWAVVAAALCFLCLVICVTLLIGFGKGWF